MRNILILDNGGKTIDRYTILDKKTGDVFGCNENPFHPLGFGQFNHNVADHYWGIAYGSSWRKRCDVKKCTAFAVDRWIKKFKGGELGDTIDYKELPPDVQKFIKERNED